MLEYRGRVRDGQWEKTGTDPGTVRGRGIVKSDNLEIGRGRILHAVSFDSDLVRRYLPCRLAQRTPTTLH